MKNFKIFILLASISAVFCGGPSPCEPFVSRFLGFVQPWLKLVDDFQNFSTYISSAYPVLTPALIEGLKCQTNGAIEFAGNAMGQIFGLDRNNVVTILNSTLVPESGTILECIGDELNYIQQRISTIFDDAIPFLESLSQTETTPNDCDEVNARLEPYFEAASISIQLLGDQLTQSRQAFSSIDMENLYLEDLTSLAPCLYRVIGIALGSVLNSDGSIITQYFNDKETVLPYPYSCIDANLEYFRRIYRELFSDLYYGRITSFDFRIPT